MEGSTVSNTLELEPQGRNLFTVLRNWRDQSEHEQRFTFVMEGMAECFPGFKRLDFVGWGPRQGAELPQPGSSDKLQPSDWSDGFLSALCLLTAAASVENGVLAIDELENSLHPELIVRMMELLREWSRKKDVTVILATHSPVVLDQFRDEPERVFVMDPNAEKNPIALDTLKKRDWLQHFSIGDLYAHGEVGSPG
jgi:predicted ATPase